LHLQRSDYCAPETNWVQGSVGLSCRYPARKSHCGCSFRVLVGLALFEASGKDSDLYHANPGFVDRLYSIAYTRAKGLEKGGLG
jgi:hypothetical protein